MNTEQKIREAELKKGVKKIQELQAKARKYDELKVAVGKIKGDIKEWYWNADKQAVAKDPCVVDAMTDMFIRTIDKHTEGLI